MKAKYIFPPANFGSFPTVIKLLNIKRSQCEQLFCPTQFFGNETRTNII